MSDRRPRSRLQRVAPLVVLLALSAVAVGAFVITQRVLDDQENRLLGQRADAVGALLTNAFDSIQSSLRALGAVGASADPAAARLFADSASPLLQRGTVAVGVATAQGNRAVVADSVGDGPAVGELLSPERSAAVARAMATGQMTSVLVTGPTSSRLVLFVPVGSGRATAYQESVITPTTPTPSTPDSPFHEVKVSLYASPRSDASSLVLTTETKPTLSGRVRNVPFAVGSDQWLLTVSPRGALIGSFAQTVPWLLLAGGLVTALLAAAVAEILVRRSAYVLTLVAQRTGQLEAALSELRETQSFVDRLLSALPVLVGRLSVDDERLTYVSPNIERVFGLSEAEALASGFLAGRIHPDDLDVVRAVLRRIAEEHVEASSEYRFRLGDGTYRWFSTVGVPEVDDAGAVTGIFIYGLDVDDRRRAEAAQRDAAQAAEAANRSKSEFLSRMSHELRTPLNAVLGFGQLLELDQLTPDQSESVHQILKGGRHLLDLINEVLDISRIESGQLPLSPEAVSAPEIIQETIDLIRPLADQRNIQIVVDHSVSADCYVFADRQRTKQILLNLLSNAVKYNRVRGTIALAFRHSSELSVRIDVTDTGRGISPEQLGMLFTPFERLGAEESEIEGTGIGLALSQRLAEAMAGSLTATSTLGRGSTFSLELPQVEGPVERYERIGGSATPRGSVPSVRRRVLHIEDNLANLKLVERILSQRPEVEVIAAMHGSLGLQLAREHRPVLILLDLHLPDINGDRVLQRLRDDPVTATTPVVIVSADATTRHVQRLLTSGATAYLTKPIDVTQLLNLVDRALERHRV